MLVTGGLGGTPDDVTREALAAAFGVPQVEFPEVTAALRARFTRTPSTRRRWALLPEGSRPLENPLGGAPGFAIGNVYVLPGLPAEMEAMFELVRRRAGGGAPIGPGGGRTATTESRIVDRAPGEPEHATGRAASALPELPPGRQRGRGRDQVLRPGGSSPLRRLGRGGPGRAVGL